VIAEEAVHYVRRWLVVMRYRGGQLHVRRRERQHLNGVSIGIDMAGDTALTRVARRAAIRGLIGK
jgi:hypothetical protein